MLPSVQSKIPQPRAAYHRVRPSRTALPPTRPAPCESQFHASVALFQRTIDEPLKYGEQIRVVIKGNLTQSGQGLLVRSISLLDLYAFLKTYRQKTQDLDQLYEKRSASWAGAEKSTKGYRIR